MVNRRSTETRPPWIEYPANEPTWGGWRQGVAEAWLRVDELIECGDPAIEVLILLRWRSVVDRAGAVRAAGRERRESRRWWAMR